MTCLRQTPIHHPKCALNVIELGGVKPESRLINSRRKRSFCENYVDVKNQQNSQSRLTFLKLL